MKINSGTGYCFEIAEKEHGLRGAMLVFARAFGATIMQRDDPIEAPPKLPEYEAYHDKRLAEALTEQAEWEAFTDAQREAWALETHKSAVAHYRQAVQEANAQNRFWDSLYRAIEGWEPPTDGHAELKKFALDQIGQSRATAGSEPTANLLQLVNERTRSLAWSVDYHRREAAQEKERHAERCAWIQTLYDSLPAEDIAVSGYTGGI